MADTPTPGQVCYDAFMAALALDHPTPWHIQDPRHHAAWEAAAEAVRAIQAAPQRETHAQWCLSCEVTHSLLSCETWTPLACAACGAQGQSCLTTALAGLCDTCLEEAPHA